MLERDSLCRLCRFRLATEIEQVVMGSDYHPSNLRGVCWRCYRRTRRERRTEQTATQHVGTVRGNTRDGAGTLVVTDGPTAGGKRFELDSGSIVAGRQPGVEVFLNDGTVSRRHAEFDQGEDADGVEIRDLDSLNGTYVNGRRVQSTTTLSSGDQIRIGAFQLVFFAGP